MAKNTSDAAYPEQIPSQHATADRTNQAPLLPESTRKSNRMSRIRDKIQGRTSKSAAQTSKWWWWEIGGALVALICHFSTTAVLLVLDGKPIDDWKPSIEPNSLLSVLTTVGKIGLTLVVGSCVSQLKWTHFRQPNSLSPLDVLDGVSRAGPLDTAKIFLKLRISLFKRIPDFMVALFAVVTLASFAIDPMVQQILKTYEDDYQFHNLTSSVLTNKHYDALVHDLKATIETQNRLQGTMIKKHLAKAVTNMPSISKWDPTQIARKQLLQTADW
jgi:hypothetical protein